MVYLCTIGHDYGFELENVIRLFYKDKKVVFSTQESLSFERGILILSKAVEEKGKYVIETSLRDDASGYFDSLEIILQDTEDVSRSNKKILKQELKRQIYIALKNYTKTDQPWGTLTGIRPGKIVYDMLEAGEDKGSILKKLMEYYFLSEKKSELIYKIAQTEKRILGKSVPNMVSLYIGIPFCPSRCLYCSFISDTIEKYKDSIESYLDTLKYEITQVNGIIKEMGYKIQSIYIGGGTPTSISSVQLKELLNHIESEFDMSHLEEYTLEAGRPDSIDAEKLKVIKDSKVDRISINPQSMNNSTLKLIGRNHSPEDVVRAFKLARSMGFDNINMDVIIGLPGETNSMFSDTLSRIRDLGPESLTVHAMAIKRSSKLNEDKDKYSMISPEEANAMLETAEQFTESMGLHPYYLYRQKNVAGNLENVGYCKPGLESIYNIQIMEEKQTILAMGAGAITKVVYTEDGRIERAFNVKNVEQYIDRIDEMIERKRVLLVSEMHLT